ncbi:hypothetical protein [Thiomicrorhabdus xiamenensis]|uniref:Outer membrane protein n=1 Tax=Thiomicrorhabdus xiamenensis TaxID=2739063 RepID=A0A7D4P3F5_9GAMM|nr:hypothetical protein [Thiomicrorhabdus xiamenensis]QKI88075.1 hypothetical protein HQN79_00070 [Thiomicrorhabdus xiamenensis]
MKKLLIGGVALSFTAISSQAVLAQDSATTLSPVAVGIGIDIISGPTLEVSYPLNGYLTLRGTLSTGWSIDEDIQDSDIDYNVESDGAINRLAVDIHPFQNGFFVSAGYGLSDFKIKPSASYNNGDSFDVNGTTYTVESATAGLNGKLDWDSAPTLSLGWGHSPEQGWGFLFEAGAVFTGSAGVRLDGYGTVSTNGGLVTYDLADDNNNVIRDEEQNLQDEVKDYDLLPILRLGATYRF